MAKTSRNPKRRTKEQQDLGAIESISYNDPAGAKKFIQIEPVVKKAVGASENVGAGKYVKVTGASYTLDLIGAVYDMTKTYQFGDVVTSGADIYRANQDKITGAFDAEKWTKVAPKTIGPVAITAGSVVCTGRWHNTVTGAGFLIDDDSDITHYRVRD